VSIAGQLSTKVTRQHQQLIRRLRRHPARHTQVLATVSTFLPRRLLLTRRHRRRRGLRPRPPALSLPRHLAVLVRVRQRHQMLLWPSASQGMELLSASLPLWRAHLFSTRDTVWDFIVGLMSCWTSCFVHMQTFSLSPRFFSRTVCVGGPRCHMHLHFYPYSLG